MFGLAHFEISNGMLMVYIESVNDTASMHGCKQFVFPSSKRSFPLSDTCM